MKNILSPKEQDRTFCFYLVTKDGMKYFHFQWPSFSMMHMRVLNTICGWENMIDWIDDEYAWPTAKMVRMTPEIRSEARKLKSEICKKDQIQENKSEVADFCKLLEPVNDDELFFIYRVVYSFPSERLLWRVNTELHFLNNGKDREDADEWYKANIGNYFDTYSVCQYAEYKSGHQKREDRRCRFCGKMMPEVSFKSKAHVIPDSLGGTLKLTCYDECDKCNSYLGKEVEKHLRRWFDFRRIIHGISKKSGGVPKSNGLNYEISSGRIKMIYDENVGPKLLGNETVTLQGIYRSLCKMVIEIVPEKYLEKLRDTVKWIMTGYPLMPRYPQIAQVGDLPMSDPCLYLFLRDDLIDADDAPMMFAVFKVFTVALLFVPPLIGGRIRYPNSYTNRINTTALTLLGFPDCWEWESYDTIEERLPHVVLDLHNAKFMPPVVIDNESDPISDSIRNRYKLWTEIGEKLWDK